jgi:hypothetical protein
MMPFVPVVPCSGGWLDGSQSGFKNHGSNQDRRDKQADRADGDGDGVWCVLCGRQSLIGTTNLKGVCVPGVIASSVSSS